MAREIRRFECPECGMQNDFLLGLIQAHAKGCTKPKYTWVTYRKVEDAS